MSAVAARPGFRGAGVCAPMAVPCPERRSPMAAHRLSATATQPALTWPPLARNPMAAETSRKAHAMQPETHALVVVDVQNDFCPGGALAVPDGDAVVPGINALMEDFATVVLTQDWHPPRHGSFASEHPGRAPLEVVEMPYGPQVLWPDHCIQGSHGAAFHPALRTDPAHLVIRKGFRRAIDSYSAFFENDHTTPTGLEGYLRTRGVDRLTMVGLATDFCVQYSALDAVRLGFAVTLRENLCRGIDLDGSLAQARDAMRAAGVVPG